MNNFIFSIILLLSIISSAHVVNTSLRCGIPYGIISKNTIRPEFHYFLTNSFTWIVLIKKINVNNQNNFCKGFLIHPSAVLTAAHCIKTELEEDLMVQASTMKKRRMFSDKKILTRNVSKILIHPNYKACDASFNHAILRLVKPFPLSRKLNVICIPTLDQLSAERDCGYTLINIKNNDLWNIPGKPNTCKFIQNLNHDPLQYMRSSCERGKNNSDLILAISAQLESCEIPNGSGQFFYCGMNMSILYTCDFKIIIIDKNDDMYDNLNWITSILLDEF